MIIDRKYVNNNYKFEDYDCYYSLYNHFVFYCYINYFNYTEKYFYYYTNLTDLTKKNIGKDEYKKVYFICG